jgi:hypothetical protein
VRFVDDDEAVASRHVRRKRRDRGEIGEPMGNGKGEREAERRAGNLA